MIYGLIRSYLSNLSKKIQPKIVWPLVEKFFLPLWFSFLLSNLILERPFLHFSPNRQWVAYLILCTHKVGTFWTKEFEVQCMPILAPEVWNMCKKFLLNHIKFFSWILYTTSWPRQLRLLSAKSPTFIGSQVRIQMPHQKMHLIFFSTDFFTFFLCICVCNTKGDAHKPCGPPKVRETLFYLVYGRT